MKLFSSSPELDSAEPDLSLWTIRIVAVVLALAEVAQIRNNYRVVDTYAPIDGQLIWDLVWRLEVAHYVRIVPVVLMALCWRWAFWPFLFSYAIVYIPNPWIPAELMNSGMMLFFAGIICATVVLNDRWLLMPWMSPKSAL